MSSDSDFIVFLDPESEGKPKEQPRESSAAKEQTGRDYFSEYMMLLTASQFLTTIQKISLYTETLTDHDTRDIVEMIEQQRAPGEFTPEQEQKLVARLAEFRARIEATDEHVQTANVRRLFEDIGTPDQAPVERVIRYYMTKQKKTPVDRDKIDLLVTRWGSFRIPGSGRQVFLRSERNLAQKLEKIFNELQLELDTSLKESEVLEHLSNYRNSLLSVHNMGEIIEKNYKTKLREYKLALGNFFYNPAVLAAIVETNITLHNILQELYLSERSRLELYVDHAKRKTGDLQASEKTGSLFTLMSRAQEMRRILDETQAAIASQQVVDQTDKPQQATSEPGRSRVDELVALLELTLQQTNDLSQQIQKEIADKYEK